MTLDKILFVVLFFTYSFNIHFLTAYYFPGAVLCSRNTKVTYYRPNVWWVHRYSVFSK